jgi:hypothetical protein
VFAVQVQIRLHTTEGLRLWTALLAAALGAHSVDSVLRREP